MGVVIDFVARALARPATPEEILIADVVAARQQVRDATCGSCSRERVTQAQARAERSVRAGLDVDAAVRRAVAWALYATDPNPPSPPATAVA